VEGGKRWWGCWCRLVEGGRKRFGDWSSGRRDRRVLLREFVGWGRRMGWYREGRRDFEVAGRQAGDLFGCPWRRRVGGEGVEGGCRLGLGGEDRSGRRDGARGWQSPAGEEARQDYTAEEGRSGSGGPGLGGRSFERRRAEWDGVRPARRWDAGLAGLAGLADLEVDLGLDPVFAPEIGR